MVGWVKWIEWHHYGVEHGSVGETSGCRVDVGGSELIKEIEGECKDDSCNLDLLNQMNDRPLWWDMEH